jgi:ribonucleases P/MRP protein subunit RPP40
MEHILYPSMGSFAYLNQQTVLILYKSVVRPHLEYLVQAWRPHLQKDMNLLENV